MMVGSGKISIFTRPADVETPPRVQSQACARSPSPVKPITAAYFPTATREACPQPEFSVIHEGHVNVPSQNASPSKLPPQHPVPHPNSATPRFLVQGPAVRVACPVKHIDSMPELQRVIEAGMCTPGNGMPVLPPRAIPVPTHQGIPLQRVQSFMPSGVPQTQVPLQRVHSFLPNGTPHVPFQRVQSFVPPSAPPQPQLHLQRIQSFLPSGTPRLPLQRVESFVPPSGASHVPTHRLQSFLPSGAPQLPRQRVESLMPPSGTPQAPIGIVRALSFMPQAPVVDQRQPQAIRRVATFMANPPAATSAPGPQVDWRNGTASARRAAPGYFVGSMARSCSMSAVQVGDDISHQVRLHEMQKALLGFA